MHVFTWPGDEQGHVSERLQEAGWGIQYITHVENNNAKKLQDRPWFNTTFSKLHVFGLTEYRKVCHGALVWSRIYSQIPGSRVRGLESGI